MLLGCIVAIAEGDFLEQLIGLFGLVFFGFAFGIMFFALFRSGSQRVLELSREGIYMSHIDVVLPWKDIGPAWISITKHLGGRTKNVVFILRNVTQHTAKMGYIGRLLMNMSKKFAHSKSGGIVDWGLNTILFAAEADDMCKQLSIELERMRNSVVNTPDTTVFNIPVPLQFGISAEDLVGIVNQEMALYSDLIKG